MNVTQPLGQTAIPILLSLFGVFFVLHFIVPLPDEDAYISYVYAKSFNEGLGLTYFGTRVEGFTNPLLVFLTILISKIFVCDPATAGFLISIGFTFALAVMLLRMAEPNTRAIASVVFTIGVAVLFFLDPVVVVWGFSGMESSMFAFFWLGSLLALKDGFPRKACAMAAVLPLIRSDALPLTLFSFLLAWKSIEKKKSAQLSYWRFCALLLFPLLLYVGFRWNYYGELVPNTAYKKFIFRPTFDRIFEGAVYVFNFVVFSKLPIVLGLLWWVRKRVRYSENNGWGTDIFLLSVLFQLIMVVYAGGDVSWKLYFRFLFPVEILVLAMVVLQGRQLTGVRQTIFILALIATKLMIWPTSPTPPRAPYSHSFYTTASFSFPGVGTGRSPPTRFSLSALFSPEDDVLSAAGRLINSLSCRENLALLTSAAGKLAYFADLPVRDLTGLADSRWRKNGQLEFAPEYSKIVAFEHHFGRPWIFDDPLRSFNQPLAAIVYSSRRYSGMPVLIFTDRQECLPNIIDSWPRFAGENVVVQNRRFKLYTDGPESTERFLKLVAGYKYFG